MAPCLRRFCQNIKTLQSFRPAIRVAGPARLHTKGLHPSRHLAQICLTRWSIHFTYSIGATRSALPREFIGDSQIPGEKPTPVSTQPVVNVGVIEVAKTGAFELPHVMTFS